MDCSVLDLPVIGGEATFPLHWLPPAPPPLWTCRPETPCAAGCSRSASLQFAYSKTKSVHSIIKLMINQVFREVE